MTTNEAMRGEPRAVTTINRSSAFGDWTQEVLALTKRWFIELSRERMNLVFSVAQPALWLLFFGSGMGKAVDQSRIGTDDYIGFMLPGMIAFTIVGNGVSGAMPLMWDKEGGYLDKLMSMPIARSSIIVSRFVYQLALSLVQVAMLLVIAVVLQVGFATGPVSALVIVIATTFLTLAVTAAFVGLAYYVPSHGTFFAVTGFVTLPLLFMSNAFVPVDAMPDWMAIVARLNPLTYAIGSMRSPIVDGWEGEILVELVVLGAVALACLAVGAKQFTTLTGDRVA